MSDYVLLFVVVFGCLIGGAVSAEIYYARKKLPVNKITNEAIVLMDEITSIVEKEVRVYITSLEGSVIKFSEIDDIIIEIFFIVKGAVSDHMIERINEINLNEIGEDFDIDNWIKNVVTHAVKTILGTK